MLKKLKAFMTTIAISGAMFVPMLVPVAVHADPNTTSSLCSGANLSVTGQACTNTGSSLNNIISWILNLFSIIVGIAAVIMIVIGGLKYTISGGDSTRVSGAKDTILFAIVGLVVVALAQIIVHFVLSGIQPRVGGGG